MKKNNEPIKPLLIQIVNLELNIALERLGYPEEEINKISDKFIEVLMNG